MIQFVFKHFEAVQLSRLNHVVGVKPKDIIPCSLAKRMITGRRKVIAPGKMKYPGAVCFTYLHSLIGGTGVHNHQVVHKGANGAEASTDNLFFVFYDHAKGQCWHVNGS